jgi:CheY-like chemotaxis protein
MTNNTKSLLLIEDNDNDIFFMKRALKNAEINNVVKVVTDGQQAIDYFTGHGEFSDRRQHPLPTLVFLDLKLPHKSGLEVLAWLRSREDFKTLVVLVLTTSQEQRDMKQAFELGANAYLAKPSSVSELTEMMKAVKAFWLTFNQFY